LDLTIPRVLMWQFLVGAALAAVLWGVYGNVIGYSALLGSLICVIPNAFLALRLVVPRRDPGAKALVGAAWVGEIGKLALTVLFFTLVFTLVTPLSAAALFGSGAFCRIYFDAVGGLVRPPDAERTGNE